MPFDLNNISYILWWVIVWFLIWFGFYLTHKDKKYIDKIKKNLKEVKKENEEIKLDKEELESQNEILKDEITNLQKKHVDFTDMVSELSRYVHHLKQWAEKAKELYEILWIYDEEFDKKINNMYNQDEEISEEERKNEDIKSSTIVWNIISKPKSIEIEKETEEDKLKNLKKFF